MTIYTHVRKAARAQSSKQMTALLGGAAVIATVVGLTAGVAPAAASPPQSGATLYVNEDPLNHANYRLAIKGVFPMLQADAVGYLIHINDGTNPGGMEYHVVADDEDGYSQDGDLYSAFLPHTQTDREGYLRAGSEGIEYLREISIPKSKLDEDHSHVNEEDEIYASAIFRDADGGRRRQFSQKIVRYFELPGTCTYTCST
jgi:hypothetical protein